MRLNRSRSFCRIASSDSNPIMCRSGWSNGRPDFTSMFSFCPVYPWARYRLFCIAPDTGWASTQFVAKTVLIADDSASMRLSVRMLLEGRHTELIVREAVDGLDAIEKAKESKPDLI